MAVPLTRNHQDIFLQVSSVGSLHSSAKKAAPLKAAEAGGLPAILLESQGIPAGNEPESLAMESRKLTAVGVPQPITAMTLRNTAIITSGLMLVVALAGISMMMILRKYKSLVAAPNPPSPKASKELGEASKESGPDAEATPLQGMDTKLPRPSSPPRTPVPHPHWAVVTIFQMAYSFCNAGMALFVMPVEAGRLNGTNASVWCGIYLACAGLSQLVCPVVGKLSDGYCSKYGRRRPFLVGGTLLCVVCMGFMKLSSIMLWPLSFMFFLFVACVGLNAAYAAHCGLPPDLEGIEPGSNTRSDDEGANSAVSGYMSLHSFIGSLANMGLVVLTRGLPIDVQYNLFICFLVVTCLVVCTTVRETSSLNDSHAEATSLNLKELCRSFSLDMKTERDFFWVCVSRMFFYGSVSSSVFMYYYLHDMVIPGATDSTIRSYVATLVIVSQVLGAMCSMPASYLSEKIGRKMSIYWANAFMSVCFCLYMIAPKTGGFSWCVVLSGGIFYGVGAAAYMGVDYALALECLPAGKSTAEAFGLWGIAGFCGSTVGPLIGGVLLWLPSASSDGGSNGYLYAGYLVQCSVIGPVMNLIGAYLVSKIQGLKEDTAAFKLLPASSSAQAPEVN